MKVLQRPAAFDQFAGEPVEQLGMGRLGTPFAEVIDGADESGAEVPVPDPLP